MSEVSENVKSGEQWLRGLFMLLFVIILEMTKVVIVAVGIIQFLFAILTGKGNSNLTRFGSSLAQFFQQIVAFLTYNDEEKPFPFAPWPEPVVVEDAEIEFGSSVAAPAEEGVVESVDEAAVETADEATEETGQQDAEADTPADSDMEEEPRSGEGEPAREQDEDSDKKPGA